MSNNDLLIRVTTNNPSYEWLIMHIVSMESWEELANVASKLAGEVTPNAIENLFEEEMEFDGYFDQFN